MTLAGHQSEKEYVMNPSPSRPFSSYLAVVLFLAVSLGACSSISLVADYDATTYEEIIRIGKKVDSFYGELLEQEQDQRQYESYSAAYVEIETEIRSLYVRNKSRPLNSESTQISQSMLDLWIKYKQRHKEKKTYSTGNATLDRNRFMRLFIAAASAEEVKNLNAGDADPATESTQ